MAKKQIFFFIIFVLFIFEIIQISKRHSLATESKPKITTHPPLSLSSPQPPPARLPATLNLCQNIYKSVCQTKQESRDPTGIVYSDVDGEKYALKLYRAIIQDHRDWTLEQIDEELVKKIFTPAQKNRIEGAFRWVLRTLEHFIDQQPPEVFNLREKNQLKSRLRKVQLQLPPPASLYADEPDLFTRNEIYYERTSSAQLRLRIGGAYVFIAKSWFNLVDTLAHELAHAIDPCEIRFVHLSFPAYDRLTACFLDHGLIATRKNRLECGENDQLSETFADWIAVQVTAEALRSFSTEFHSTQIINAARNSVRDLCEQDSEDTELDLEHHPSPQVRIAKIFGENPLVRQVLGCSPSENISHYCTFESTLPYPSKGKP